MAWMWEAAGAVLLLALGGVLGWLAMWRRLRRVLAREQALAEAVRKMNHDLRGALSPAMLLGERLEAHADPAVAKAAGVISKALDRATEAAKPAAALARAIAPTPKPKPDDAK
jgi:signal transduction histidine kinase